MSGRGATLLSITAVCAAFWFLTLLYPLYSGAAAMILGSACLGFWLVAKVRQAFPFGSHNLADFVAGRAKHKPAENPLLLDPFYASVITQIEEARAKHKPVRHLYAKRDHRVNELLGKKGVA